MEREREWKSTRGWKDAQEADGARQIGCSKEFRESKCGSRDQQKADVTIQGRAVDGLQQGSCPKATAWLVDRFWRHWVPPAHGLLWNLSPAPIFGSLGLFLVPEPLHKQCLQFCAFLQDKDRALVHRIAWSALLQITMLVLFPRLSCSFLKYPLMERRGDAIFQNLAAVEYQVTVRNTQKYNGRICTPRKRKRFVTSPSFPCLKISHVVLSKQLEHRYRMDKAKSRL